MRKFLLTLIIALMALPVFAEAGHAAVARPDALIEQATEDLLAIIEQARDYYDEDPERFYAEVEQVITPIVDFYSFSRGVMGNWGSKKYFESLQSEQQRRQFDQQVDRFMAVFRRVLVETYGKGLMAFGGESIVVQPVAESDLDKGSVYVIQSIQSEEGEPHIIRYRMRRDREGRWRMRNVILDEVNLGVVYRNQFAAAATKYDGDIDQVIDTWSVSKGDED